MRRWLIFVAIGAAVFSASNANAAEPPEQQQPSQPVVVQPQATAEPARRRTLLIEGAAGMGTPLGWLGASVIVSPVSELALHGGVGIGTQGIQITAGLRGRIKTSEHNFISIGGAWSTGQHAAVGNSFVPNWDYTGSQIWFWERAHVLNLEGSFEHDARAVVLRPFVGFGYVLNGDDAFRAHEVRSQTCAGCSPGFFGRFIPYLGFAVAFGVL